MTEKRTPRLIDWVWLLFFFITACRGTASSLPASPAEIPQGGTLSIALDRHVASFDPVLCVDNACAAVISQVAEGLLTFDENGVLKPRLAQEWHAQDPQTYIFTLRGRVLFHDGRPLTVEDVIFSLEHARTTDLAVWGGKRLGYFESISKVDERTIKITLSRPDSLFPYRLATSAGTIISKVHCLAQADSFGEPHAGLVGSGPFKVSASASETGIVLEKNGDYWDKARRGPYLDSVFYMIIPSAPIRMGYLRSDEAGLAIANIPGDQIPILQRSQMVTLAFADGLGGDALIFNTRRPPFDDRAIRRAVNLTVDKSGVLSALYGEAVSPAKATTVTPAMWSSAGAAWQAAWDELPDTSRDIEKARQVLGQAGVDPSALDGRAILVDDDPIHIAEAIVVQAAAAELGFDWTISQVTPGEVQAALSADDPDFDLLIYGWNGKLPDPAAALVPFFHSRSIGGEGRNVAGYSNPAVDRLLDEQDLTPDTAERARLLIQAQALIAEDSPWIVFGYPKAVMALNRRYTGYHISPAWQWDAFAKNIHLAQP